MTSEIVLSYTVQPAQPKILQTRLGTLRRILKSKIVVVYQFRKCFTLLKADWIVLKIRKRLGYGFGKVIWYVSFQLKVFFAQASDLKFFKSCFSIIKLPLFCPNRRKSRTKLIKCLFTNYEFILV